MTSPWSRKVPNRPTRKAVLAAFNMNRPLNMPEKPLVRKKPRKWVDDTVPEMDADNGKQ